MRVRFIHEFCKAVAYNGQPVLYIQQKLDGHRLTALRQPPNCDNPLVLYTRSQSDLYPELRDKALHHDIWPWLADLLNLPIKSSVDGELWVPGKPASYVKTAIKENDPSLRFTAFAIPWLAGQRRYTDPLEWAMQQASMFQIPFAPFHKLDTVQSVDPDVWIKKALPDTEGWVLKKHHYAGWYKLKRVKTIDLIVMGCHPGKGKYEGQIGSIQCGLFGPEGALVEICLCSGMTDEERKAFSEKDVGRVCEVQFQEVSSLGRLRHPNFVRWRDEEKKPYECTLAQDPELLRYWGDV